MEELKLKVREVEVKTDGRCNDPRLLRYIDEIKEDIKKECK